ncbi:MAG: hypothetical protein RL336_1128 [Pseudomonadota bacterium]
MEDIIEQLQALSEHVPVPLDLPDEDDLLEVEETLLLPIHPSLRHYLLEASDTVYGSLEPVTCVDPQSHTYLADVTALAWDEGMPREYMVICETADGFYCINHEDGEILFWSRLQFDFEAGQQWDSLWDWIEDVWLRS